MEIISYKDAPNGSKYIAELEVYYERIYFRRIRVTLSQKGHHFINLPVYGEDDSKGGKRWIQFWEWSKDKETEFKRECLEAIQPYLNKQSTGSYSSQLSQAAPLPPKPIYEGTFNPDLNDCPF